MAKKLYIDKSCDICLKYASYIESNKTDRIAILDIKDLKEESFSKDEIVFEVNNDFFCGPDAILESMATSRSSPTTLRILKITPRFIRAIVYRILSKNKYKISKLFNIVEPKS